MATNPDPDPTEHLRYPVLSYGVRDEAVTRWRSFLRTQIKNSIAADLSDKDNSFDGLTDALTRTFQSHNNLPVDGVVGARTWEAAEKAEPDLVAGLKSARLLPSRYPPPEMLSRMTKEEADQEFGPPDDSVTDDWVRDNIIPVSVPQLGPIPGAPDNGIIRFHRKAADRLVQLFRAWEQARLMSRVRSFEGSFINREERPDPTRGTQGKPQLSMHARGLAFDINSEWNLVGQEPATPSQLGCVYDLVKLAYENGFCWGGHFDDRLEGCQFEIGVAVEPKKEAVPPQDPTPPQEPEPAEPVAAAQAPRKQASRGTARAKAPRPKRTARKRPSTT